MGVIIWSQELTFVQAIIYGCCIVSVYEWMVNMDFEISIWKKTWCAAKWHYLASRYLNILGHILLVIAANTLYSSRTPIPRAICFSWHIYTIWTSLFMFGLREALSATQARVLWDRRQHITLLLVAIVVIGFMACFGLSAWLFTSVHFEDSCEIKGFPILMVIIPGFKVLTQFGLWALIAIKCHKLRAPVLATLRRDISLTSTVIILMMFGVGAHFIVAPHNKQAQKAYLVLYPIFMTITSSVNCIAIKNMHLHSSPREHMSSDVNEVSPSARILSTFITEYWSGNSVDLRLNS